MIKRLFVTGMLFCIGIAAFAQQKDTSLLEYVGKYSFPEGSFVTTAEISLTDTVLTVSSSQGGSPLQKLGKDTFLLTDFAGSRMIFYRNAAGKVARIKVEVNDILLEGTKDGVPTSWISPKIFFDNRNKNRP